MLNLKKLLCILMCFSLSIILLNMAIDAEELMTLEDLDVKIIDTPVIRSDLYFADVRDDGWFALGTWNTTVRDPNCIREKFFDIYNAEGAFQKTVRLVSQKPVYFELTENALNIYIYPTEIICDLTSGELHVCQSNLSEEEIRQLNTKKRFPVGEWTYMFRGITRPYSAFYRTNGNQTQLLVKTEGNAPTGTQALIISGIAAIASLIALSFIVVFLRRSKKKQNSMPTKD